jgi:hypothetical protein
MTATRTVPTVPDRGDPGDLHGRPRTRTACPDAPREAVALQRRLVARLVG